MDLIVFHYRVRDALCMRSFDRNFKGFDSRIRLCQLPLQASDQPIAFHENSIDRGLCYAQVNPKITGYQRRSWPAAAAEISPNDGGRRFHRLRGLRDIRDWGGDHHSDSRIVGDFYRYSIHDRYADPQLY